MSEDLRAWLADDAALSPEELTERLRRRAPSSAAAPNGSAVHGALRRRSGFGPLSGLLRNDDVNDICLNGPGEAMIDAGGSWHRSGVVLDRDELTLVVERLLAHAGRKVDRLHPLVDARLDDGSRINVAVAPAAIGGPLVTIRRFRSSRLTLEDFATPEQAVTLRTHLRDGSNILVSGATGAGKTSLVGALMAELQPDERVVLIEDTAELPGDRHSVVRLEAQPAAVAGTPPVTLRDLVRNALRMRPDRLVLGEVRGPEALDLLLALTTGHRGSLSTCHGNGPAEVLERLAVLAQLSGQADPSAIESMIGSGIDLVVHVERSGSHRFIDAMLGVTDDWRQPR